MKQHFVPVFYLKRFTLDDGHFLIYNVKSGKLKKNGKRFSPDSHFFEIDLNTLSHEGKTSYFIEDRFTKHDTEIGALLAKIDGQDNTVLTPYEWTNLQYFINILYWRNPSTTTILEDLIKNAKNLSPFGASLRDAKTGERLSDQQEQDLILKNPQFLKFLRLQMAGNTYPEVFQKTEQDHVSIITFPPGLPKFVSDNPVIYLNEPGESLHTAPLIFPLTPTKILFRHLRPNFTISTKARPLIDMILMSQATNYVSTTDDKYPGLLLEALNEDGFSIKRARSGLGQLLR